MFFIASDMSVLPTTPPQLGRLWIHWQSSVLLTPDRQGRVLDSFRRISMHRIGSMEGHMLPRMEFPHAKSG